METVFLVTLENVTQAHMVQDVLKNEGIESFLKNETLSTVLSIPGFLVELSVFEADFERAKEILQKGFPHLFE